MTAAALTPRVRMMAICDGVRKSRTEVDVFHLKSVRHWITVEELPFATDRLWLFLVLSNPRTGEFPCYLRIVEEETNRVIYYTYLKPRPVFRIENGLFMTKAQIRCSFPRQGLYTIQVWFFQSEANDVLKGEMTFEVKMEQ